MYGTTMSIDLHGLTVEGAKNELNHTLSSCPPHVTEIEVIHGYREGNFLQQFVRRNYSHPKIKQKIITMNNGMTTFLLKK
jgi:DNA-nicking Smr family endonuclease